MLNLVWNFSNIEMELAETIYVITMPMPTKKIDFTELNAQYLVTINIKIDQGINHSHEEDINAR